MSVLAQHARLLDNSFDPVLTVFPHDQLAGYDFFYKTIVDDMKWRQSEKNKCMEGVNTT